MRITLCLLFIALLFTSGYTGAQQLHKSGKTNLRWWQHNNLRVIQTNLPDYEAATLNADSLVADLRQFSANTLIINAGGIMAFYPTKLNYHYQNPYVKGNTLKQVVAKCHQYGIKVIVRFDFSRVHESIFKQHPDWCYISPKGERMVNTNMYTVSINGPYVQQCAFNIVKEVMDNYPIDGIFLNMPGYLVNNTYEKKYMGIDQNEHDKKSFARYSGGKQLPVEENKADSLYQLYLAFKKHTVEDWSRRLYEQVKAKNPDVAICTYTDKYVDIIRHETQAVDLPLWPYAASDNVNNAGHSFPNHIISNASIQQISFQSRYNAVEPHEVAIRLYQNMANGSGLDMSMMGDTRGYEDERNYETFKRVYGLHKKFEPYFGRYTSVARIAVVSPGSWPSGLPMQEYRGIQLMLKEAHIPFDIIEDNQLQNQPEKVKQYKLIILPDITYLNAKSITLLNAAVNGGTNLIATNTALSDNAEALMDLFGAGVNSANNDGAGNYFVPDDRSVFKSFKGQSMVHLRYNLGSYDFSKADKKMLPILAKGRPGPPEIIGGHTATGNYAVGIKYHGKAAAVIMPFNLGSLYYLNGYEQHKNILLDIIDHLYPEGAKQLITDVHPKVETVLQQYAINTAHQQSNNAGLILHLINLTGVSSASFLKPLPVNNASFSIKVDFTPSSVKSMIDAKPLAYEYANGYVTFKVDSIDEYTAVLINR